MNNTAYKNSIVLQIDEGNRSITNNGENVPIILGVKGDDCAERVYFESPRFLSPEIDLLDETEGVEIRVYVNYQNAVKEPYIQECTDVQTIINGENVNFSWLVTNKATYAKGYVLFNVCIKKFVNNELTNEWHTTTFTGKVLDSIDVTAKTPEVITHDSVTLQGLTAQVSDYSTAVKGYANSVNDLIAKYDDVEAAIDASVTSKMEPYATTEYVNGAFAMIDDLNDDVADAISRVSELESKAVSLTKTVVLENLNATINTLTNVGDANPLGMALGDLSYMKHGDIMRVYFGLTDNSEYYYLKCFVIEIPIVRNTPKGLTCGQASHHIRIGDVFEGVLFAVVHGENTYKQLSLTMITKLYNATGLTNQYGSNMANFTFNKIEIVSGLGN